MTETSLASVYALLQIRTDLLYAYLLLKQRLTEFCIVVQSATMTHT